MSRQSLLTADNGSAIVEFAAARLPLDEAHGAMAPISLHLERGDLALVNPADPYHATVLVDAACGLCSPREGAVRFLGNDWSSVTDDFANALRGRIGFVLSGGNWIEHLPVRDSILLPQLHHTRRPLAALEAEASRLAALFGLPGLPMSLPHELLSTDLRRAACVRAFLGNPDFVILENPTQGMYADIIEPLVNATRRVRDHGGAVMWLTIERQVWFNNSIPADRRFRLRGNYLLEMKVHS